METVHNVINLCALFDVGVDVMCASNAVHKVPNERCSVARPHQDWKLDDSREINCFAGWS